MRLMPLDEGKAYLLHPILGTRLREITTSFIGLSGVNAKDVFGYLDAMKDQNFVEESFCLFLLYINYRCPSSYRANA